MKEPKPKGWYSDHLEIAMHPTTQVHEQEKPTLYLPDQYDHHLGYAPEHRLDVQPVCVRCHVERAIVRGELKRVA